VAFDGSLTFRSSRVSLPFLISMLAPMRSPVAFSVSFSGSASILTWSLTRFASSMASRMPCVVAFAVTVKVIFGVGTSSSWASRVGMLKARVYFPVMVIFSRPVFSSRASSTGSSFPARLRSFSISLMFRHIFVGWSHWYSSKIVFGHSKSTMATLEGSMARSFMPSGVRLNVASSTSMLMALIMSRRSFASATLILNKH